MEHNSIPFHIWNDRIGHDAANSHNIDRGAVIIVWGIQSYSYGVRSLYAKQHNAHFVRRKGYNVYHA